LIVRFERLHDKVEYHSDGMQAERRVVLTVSAGYLITEL